MTAFIGKEHTYFVRLAMLITEARSDGIHLSIDTQARHPLAMGNYDMRASVRYSREAQLKRLWMLHIEGPDDIVAAPSFMEAVAVAAQYNAYWSEVKARHNSEHYPTLRAVVHEWDGEPWDHQASVDSYWADYLGYDDALKALKAQQP